MTWPSAIEYIETFDSPQDAEEALEFLGVQVDYRGGRLLPPTFLDPHWRTQTFFDDVPEAEWLPDGCHRRVIPPGIQTLFVR